MKDPLSPSGSSVVLYTQGNNPDLKEETASTWTAGVDLAFRSLPQSSLSLTYYSIKYTDRIVLPGYPSLLDILLQGEQWAPVINRNPSSADIEAICSSPFFFGSVEQCRSTPVAAIIDYHYRNLSSSRMNGIDASFDQSLDTSRGSFRFGLRGTYLLSFDQAASRASPMVSILDTAANPLSLRLRGTAEWYQHHVDMPGWGASLAVDHSGGYRDTDADSVRGVAGFSTVDLSLSYRTSATDGLLGDVEFRLNAANVFNRDPPFLDREDGYDLSNSDPYGRVLSLGIQKKW
jgi:iron complex outermembrane receptor protein